MEWPPIPGRYYVGNKNACIAICTLASIDLPEKLNEPKYLEKIAIVGKTVTENVGIEKLVKNVVSNPNIRFLILCGMESRGHYVGQAIISLANNGIDENGKIIDAKGPLPSVKNLTKQQVEIFRKQIKVIDMIGNDNLDEIMKEVNKNEENNPGPFKAKIKIEKVPIIHANYDPSKEWTADKTKDKGWFAIHVDKEKGKIIVEYYENYGKDAKLKKIIDGESTEQIAGTITKLGLIKGIYHAAYLGKELQKAEIALKNNLPYEQEKELDLKNIKK